MYINDFRHCYKFVSSILKEQHGYSKTLEEHKSEKNKIEARKLATLRASGENIPCADLYIIDVRISELMKNMEPGIFKRCDYESISKIFNNISKLFYTSKHLIVMKMFRNKHLPIFTSQNI